MNDKKKGLGRGLGDLLPSGAWLKAPDIQLFYCPIQRLTANPYQPRQRVEDRSFPDLVESIREKGVIQPLLVTRIEAGDDYQILAGERRWRAAKAAGLTQVPVIVRESTSNELLELAIVENVQRSDLTCIEEALAYRRLQDDFQLTQEQIAGRVGKNRTTVTNLIRLLQLPPEIQEDLLDGRLTMGHARALLALKNRADQVKVRDTISKRHLSVRQTEELVQRLTRPSAARASRNPAWRQWQQALRSHLGADVRLQQRGQKRSITISLDSEEQLKAVLQRLGLPPEHLE